VPTLGASGAVYGLLGGAIVMARNRQIDLMQSGLVPILALNLAITILFSNRGISLGGHVGGLIAGFIATWVVEELAKRRGSEVPAIVSCVIMGAALVAGSIVAAS
jgi:membrane associated rhomboid family serine protease